VLEWFFGTLKRARDGKKANYENTAFSYSTQPQQTTKLDCALYMLHYMKRVFSFIQKKGPTSLSEPMPELV
jgi:hypothetical protein